MLPKYKTTMGKLTNNNLLLKGNNIRGNITTDTNIKGTKCRSETELYFFV
jgi:hypothetical protein